MTKRVQDIIARKGAADNVRRYMEELEDEMRNKDILETSIRSIQKDIDEAQGLIDDLSSDLETDMRALEASEQTIEDLQRTIADAQVAATAELESGW